MWWWDQTSLPWVGSTTVNATTFERTVVDLLDRQEWCPPQIAHNRPSPRRMIDYALKLGSQSAGATREDLQRLPRPKSAMYFDERTRKEDRQLYRTRWNLMIPSVWLHYVQQTDFYEPVPRFTKIVDPRW